MLVKSPSLEILKNGLAMALCSDELFCPGDLPRCLPT